MEEKKEEKEEKDRFHGEAGEVIWAESEEAMLKRMAAEGYKWFQRPNGRRIDLTKYLEEKE